MERLINIEILQDMQALQQHNNKFSVDNRYQDVSVNDKFMAALCEVCIIEFEKGPVVHFESIENLKLSTLKYN